jgi:hypothetical protein
MPGIVTHGGAFAGGHFQGLHGRKTFKNLAYAEPRDEHEGNEQDHAAGENVPPTGAAQEHEQHKDTDLGGKTEDAAAGCGQKKRDDWQESKYGHGKPTLSADFAKYQRNQSERYD